MKLNTQLPLDTILTSPNLAELLDAEDLAKIGHCVLEEWQIDKTSREPWEEKTAFAMKLAMQVTEDKTFPWQGASNIKFPLVTIAAMQYQARAYPALLPGPDVVKCVVYGPDEDSSKENRAKRIADHMSYQILEEDEAWEENMDKVLISQSIVGCAFKKTYFSPSCGHNVSEHVLAKDLYIPYYAPSLEKAARISQIIYLSENDLYERYKRGLFLALSPDSKPYTQGSSVLEEVRQKDQGLTKPGDDSAQPYEFIEQHRYLDLDGDDYQEPYIVTVRKDTQQVMRIVARFKESSIEKEDSTVIKITPDHYFTKFPFIPSPDGGIYDLGFGVLLSPLNESINTIVNQLVDAGTLSNTAGGFLGRGVKFRSGENNFRPFEWKRVDSTGDDLRKGVFPLPVREPSQVLFSLLSLLIDYGERIGMAVDPLVGVNPGQNTPAETSRNMIQEGQRVFSSVFKRTYRSLKEEFRKLYNLNRVYLADKVDYYSAYSGTGKVALAEDYAGYGENILPAADPNMTSREQKMMQATLLKQAAMSAPGYNQYEVEKKYLQALGIQNIELIYPDPKGPNALPPSPNTDVVMKGMELEVKKLDIMLKNRLAMVELLQQADVNRAKIIEMEANATKLMAEAAGVDTGQKIAAMQTAIGLAKSHQDGILKAAEILSKTLESKEGEGSGKLNERGMGLLEAAIGNSGTPEIPTEAPVAANGGLG